MKRLMCDTMDEEPVPERMILNDLGGEAVGAQWCDDVCDHDCVACPVQEAFNRLAQYEATGLTPEEIRQTMAARA